MSARRHDHWMVLEDTHVVGRRDGEGYSREAVADLLEAAEAAGFDLSPQSTLDQVTVGELQMLVHPHGAPC